MTDRAASLCRATLAAVIAADAAFVAPSWSPMRVLWYQPLLRRWIFVVHPDELGMDWYGRMLLSIAGGALAFGLVHLWGRRRDGSKISLPLWTGWVVLSTTLVAALFVFQLASRSPTPEPLPKGYVPR